MLFLFQLARMCLKENPRVRKSKGGNGYPRTRLQSSFALTNNQQDVCPSFSDVCFNFFNPFFFVFFSGVQDVADGEGDAAMADEAAAAEGTAAAPADGGGESGESGAVDPNVRFGFGRSTRLLTFVLADVYFLFSARLHFVLNMRRFMPFSLLSS